MNRIKSIFEGLFVWNIPPADESDLATADAIVTQAHGRLKNGLPGPGNKIMAEVARKLYEQYKLPIVPQEEVAMADPSLPYYEIVGGSPDGQSNLNWNTYVIASRQADICRKNGWKKVIVVAFPMHMGRSVMVYRKLGLSTLPAKMPTDIKPYMDKNLVPSEFGGILSVGTPFGFMVREMLCRVLFLYKGWI